MARSVKNGNNSGTVVSQGMGTRYYTEELCITVYELAKDGLSSRRMSKVLGIDVHTFKKWRRKHPALDEAVRRGRGQITNKNGEIITDFREYVYERLPEPLKKLWDAINAVEEGVDIHTRNEALLTKAGKRARQHIFLYALTFHNFSVSRACKAVNIAKCTFDLWCEKEPDFVRLMDEMHFHKKNFFEEGLVKLVAAGDSAATIFANKTINRDRGYSEKLTVEHTGEVAHTHSIGVDNLPLELRKQLLEHIRNKFKDDMEKGHKALEDHSKDGVMDYEDVKELVAQE